MDVILFDDDYRYGHLNGAQGCGCVCDNHIRYAEEILGEKFPDDVIEKYLVYGGRNKYRSAWLKANKHYLLKFAEDMRKAVDTVNPSVRIGLCSCMSVWDYDGASSVEISKTLAGNTKPFLRLIGAPYWANKMSWGNRLQDVIELERMELSWCENEDIEILGEGDVFPRPRFACPSSFLEGFDTALRVDGGLILDARAAEILTKKGVDVGITGLGENLFEKLSANPPTEEYFVSENTFVAVDIFSGVYSHKISEKADVQSYLVNGNDKYPASYTYKNKDGQKFFVLLFEGYFASEKFLRQYTRQRQLVENIEWMSGRKLPAVITGHPDLYVMCKEKDGALAVGLWNFFPDKINKPVIKLDKKYSSIRFANCNGNLSGDTVTLSKLGAYEYAFFEVK